MGLYVKTSTTGLWPTVKKAYIKTSLSGWSSIKKIYVKISDTVSPYWKIVFGSLGPESHSSPYIITSLATYGSTAPVLTGYNYHWFYDTSLTLTYNFQNGATTGSLTDIFSTNKPFTPGNPTLAAEPNSIQYTPVWPTDYLSDPTYFSFSITAVDKNGINTLQSSSISISLPTPLWLQASSFTGTTFSPGYTFAWNAGKALINGSSSGVGYMTTVYKTNDGGVTKTYIVGTATNPDFQYSDYYTYNITASGTDSGYTYYGYTYAVASKPNGPMINAPHSTLSSDYKSIISAPGPFSITSFVKGKNNVSYRILYVNFSTSQYATAYEYYIEYSTDNINWGVIAFYSTSNQILAPNTSFTYTTNQSTTYPYYRITMRATNSAGLYTVSSNVAVQATGTPPSAPTILGLSPTQGPNYLNLNFSPPSDLGSGSQVVSYNIYYRVKGTIPYSFVNVTYFTNYILLNNLTANTTYEVMLQAITDDGLAGADSNLFTARTLLPPDPLGNFTVKSFVANSLTFTYTTGNNTTDIYYVVTSGPYGGPNDYVDDKQGIVAVNSNSSGTYTISGLYWADAVHNYDVTLYPMNSDYYVVYGYGPGQSVYNVMDMGQDFPAASNPTYTNMTATSVVANYTLFNTSSVFIDVKDSFNTSISGYPKTLNNSSGLSGTAYTESIAGLTNGNTYTVYVTPQYTVSPFNYSGTTRNSSIKINILQSPISLSATTSDSSGITLNWSGGYGASYDIVYNNSSTYSLLTSSGGPATVDFMNISSSPHKFTEFAPYRGIPRWFWIRSNNGSGTYSTWYPFYSGKGIYGYEPLYAPNNISSTSTSNVGLYSITWNWAAPSTDSLHDAASSYDYFLSTSNSYPTVSSGTNTTATSITTSYLSPDTSYYFWIMARNADATSSGWTGIGQRTLPSPPPYHTVTFLGNGNTSGSMSPQTANTITPLTPNAFVRTGYSFLFWNTAADGSGTSYLDGYGYPFTSDITLYAIWTQNQVAPTNANVYSYANNTFYFTWTPPSSVGSYRIEALNLTTFNTTYLYPASNASSYLDTTSFVNGTNYSLSIRAYSGINQTGTSSSIYFTGTTIPDGSSNAIPAPSETWYSKKLNPALNTSQAGTTGQSWTFSSVSLPSGYTLIGWGFSTVIGSNPVTPPTKGSTPDSVQSGTGNYTYYVNLGQEPSYLIASGNNPGTTTMWASSVIQAQAPSGQTIYGAYSQWA